MSLTQAQLVARATAIGGSDAAAICGKDPYRNPYLVAMRLTGELPPDPDLADKDQILFGNEMEGVLARIYEHKHKVTLYTPETIYHPNEKQILVHIDRRRKDDPRIGIECKNTGLHHVKDSAPVTERWGKPGTDEIPERVTLQCFHGMMCVPEIQIFHVLRCYGGNQYHEYFVPRDNGAIEALYTIEKRFLENVRAGRLPSPDWFHTSTEDAFKRMFKRLQGVIEKRDDLEHWTRCWLEAEAVRREAEKLSFSIKNRIVFLMANTEVGLLADGKKWVRKLIKKKGYEVEPSEYIECRLVKPRKKKESPKMEAKTTTPQPVKAAVERQGVIQWAGERFGIETGKVLGILRDTVFRTGPNDAAATDAECAALLVVAKEYGLNPFTKEIFAFKDKFKGIVPIVSVDGWANLVNSHKDFNGVEFETGPEMEATHAAADGLKRKAFGWVKCRMYHKGRDRPIEVTEYFDEVYQEPRGANKTPGPWQTHPKRMHRHKVYIQCARLAFGFAGIYDEDEAERIIGSGPAEPVIRGAAAGGPSSATAVATEVFREVAGTVEAAATRTSTLAADLARQAAGAEDATVVHDDSSKGPQPEAPGAAAGPQPAAGGTSAAEELPWTKETIEAKIPAAATMDDTQAIFEAILSLPPVEQPPLMKKWDARVKELKGVKPAEPKPKQKPFGTKEQLDEFIDRMEKAKNTDELDLASDATRDFRWAPGQSNLLADKYTDRAKALKTT